MVAKTNKAKVGELASKAFYNLLKTNMTDNAIYAGVSYISDSEYLRYSGSLDSESTFYGGEDSEYGTLDKNFYDQTMYSMHRALPGGVCRVVPRIDWVYETIYESYPSKSSYVLVREYDSGYLTFNVYRCLFSPNKPSLYAPTTSSNVPMKLGDGYVWKYLYTITNSSAIRFLSEKWMPVVERLTKTEIAEISSDSVRYNQYISQINAQPGEVHDIVIDSDALVTYIQGDSDFDNTFNWKSINLIGLDHGLNKPSNTFKVQLTWDSEYNKFTKTLIESGSGYIGPVSIQIDSDKESIGGITCFASPGEGHGADVPVELHASNTMVSVRNVPDENNKVVYGGSEANLLTLQLNPIDKNTNLIATGDFYVACNYFEIDENITYKIGEIIRPNLNDDGRRGLVVSTVDKKVYYVSPINGRQFDVFYDSEIISLENGNKIKTIKKSYTRDVVYGSSDLLIADYIDITITRSEGQIESFNFILSF